MVTHLSYREPGNRAFFLSLLLQFLGVNGDSVRVATGSSYPITVSSWDLSFSLQCEECALFFLVSVGFYVLSFTLSLFF